MKTLKIGLIAALAALSLTAFGKTAAKKHTAKTTATHKVAAKSHKMAGKTHKMAGGKKMAGKKMAGPKTTKK